MKYTLNNHELKELLSLVYPFDFLELKEFSCQVNWKFISSNWNVQWHESLVNTYKHDLDWQILQKNRTICNNFSIAIKFPVECGFSIDYFDNPSNMFEYNPNKQCNYIHSLFYEHPYLELLNHASKNQLNIILKSMSSNTVEIIFDEVLCSMEFDL